MEEKTKGSHEWIIEFEKEPKDLNHFAKLLDEELQKKILTMKLNVIKI